MGAEYGGLKSARDNQTVYQLMPNRHCSLSPTTTKIPRKLYLPEKQLPGGKALLHYYNCKKKGKEKEKKTPTNLRVIAHDALAQPASSAREYRPT